MTYRDGLFATTALVLSSAALAGILYSDDYSQAAQSEASAYDALFYKVSNGAARCASSLVQLDADKAVQ